MHHDIVAMAVVILVAVVIVVSATGGTCRALFSIPQQGSRYGYKLRMYVLISLLSIAMRYNAFDCTKWDSLSGSQHKECSHTGVD